MPIVSGDQGSINRFTFLSTETKPTVGVPSHSIGIESDTGDIYIFDRTSWRKFATAGVLNTVLSGGTLDYGTYPQRDYVDINGTLTASATATLYESNDISAYSSMGIWLSSITAGDNVKAYPSYNGTTFASGVINLAWRNLTTDAVIAGTTGLTAAGLYSLVLNAGPMKVRKIRLTYTAVTTGSVAFTGGIW